MLAIIKASVPKRPITTPKISRFVTRAPKATMPTTVVSKGTTELKMDVTPLSISVCATANRKGGKKELRSPAAMIHFQSLGLIVLRLRYPNKNKTNDAKTMRKPPNCKGVRPKSAFFIRIKDEPQTRESKIK